MKDSPFQRLRLLTETSQTAFAHEAGLSRVAVVNLEAGMYQRVPIRANQTLARLCKEKGIPAVSVLLREYSASTLDEAMDQWKADKRFETDLSDWPKLTLKQIIARFPSPGTFCRGLCIPSSAIYHAMYGKSKVTPDVIREALRDARYSYVDDL